MRGLKYLFTKSSPLGVFLIETKAGRIKMSKIAKSLSFDNVSVVEAKYNACGLAFLRKSELDWSVVYKLDWVI